MAVESIYTITTYIMYILQCAFALPSIRGVYFSNTWICGSPLNLLWPMAYYQALANKYRWWASLYVFKQTIDVSWRRKWQPTPGFSPRESHGQRSQVGWSPWGHRESDMNEHLSTEMFKLAFKATLIVVYYKGRTMEGKDEAGMPIRRYWRCK